MIKKDNKIQVVISKDPLVQRKMLAQLAVQFGFARIPSDAIKIVSSDIYSINLQTSYFVLCSDYNFRGASITNQRLYELAARGIFVAVGVRSLPREYEFICNCYYPEDLK